MTNKLTSLKGAIDAALDGKDVEYRLIGQQGAKWLKISAQKFLEDMDCLFALQYRAAPQPLKLWVVWWGEPRAYAVFRSNAEAQDFALKQREPVTISEMLEML